MQSLPHPPLLERPSKIAVLRANGIGDFVFSLPALETLRQAYPDAEIVFLGNPWAESFLQHRPSPVDRAITVPSITDLRIEKGDPGDETVTAQFLEAMREEQFDLALQMHGGGRHSNRIVSQMGARTTAGFRTPDAPALDIWIPYVYYQHEVHRYLELCGALGLERATEQPRITVTERDLAEVEQKLGPITAPLVALSPGASEPRRRWSPARFAEVGDALAADGLQIVVTGSSDERPLGEAICSHMAHPAENLAGELSVGGLAGLLSRCRLVVSNDSGPLHLASAVGTPTVGVYWFFNIITAGPIDVARHRPVTSERTDCPECGRNCVREVCEHTSSLVDDAPVDDVIFHARDLLRRPSNVE